MRKRSLRAWIKKNREEIDSAIKAAGGREGRRNDDERELWVLSDEGLYLWAMGEGVEVD